MTGGLLKRANSNGQGGGSGANGLRSFNFGDQRGAHNRGIRETA